MSKDAVVLVVDDERDHADGMAEALQKSCAKAIAVYTGHDALEIIRSQNIDVVVTDLKLGGQIDGLDILREAKKSGQTEVISPPTPLSIPAKTPSSRAPTIT
ncbi:MAG: response regulator [Sedimentisphaerales bacterium]